MNILKLNSSKKFFTFTSVIIEQLKKNVRTLTNKSKKNPNNEPISMSYASYESTESISGPQTTPLIVMHGLFGSKGNWNSLCKAMQSKSNPKRKIIAADARNHGDSPHIKSHSYDNIASDIKQLMINQNIPKACLLGHSMGGKAVMYFALKFPELVDKLIIVDISPFAHIETMGTTHMFLGYMHSIKIQPNIPLSEARRMADSALAKHINCKGIRAFLLTNLVRKDDGSYAWRLNIPVLAAYYQRIANFPPIEGLHFNGDALLVYGGQSDFVQPKDFKRFKDIFPKLQIEVIKGAGHWLHSESPEQFLKYVLDFLNKK